MKTFIRALVLLALSTSSIGIARDYSDTWTLFQQATAETVQIQAPKIASASKPTEVSVLVGLPSGCYKTEIIVEHENDFTHVLKPELQPGIYPCLQVSRFDFQKASLGTLQAGEHRLFVENVSRPVAPTTFWVADDVTAVATD